MEKKVMMSFFALFIMGCTTILLLTLYSPLSINPDIRLSTLDGALDHTADTRLNAGAEPSGKTTHELDTGTIPVDTVSPDNPDSNPEQPEENTPPTQPTDKDSLDDDFANQPDLADAFTPDSDTSDTSNKDETPEIDSCGGCPIGFCSNGDCQLPDEDTGEENPDQQPGENEGEQNTEESENTNEPTDTSTDDDDDTSGGGGPSRTLPSGSNGNTACESSWVCGGWSECADGMQERDCYDEAQCVLALNKPVTTRACTSPPTPPQEDNPTLSPLVPLIKSSYLFLFLLVGIITTIISMKKMHQMGVAEKIGAFRDAKEVEQFVDHEIEGIRGTHSSNGLLS